jgi:NAD(P)-dependent dehydrogenase (short-subunit alcohol dehydrogenase family)
MLDFDRQPEVIADMEDVDMSGTQVLVTGSTNGIGRHAALAMGRLGADVIVHGRDQERGAETVDALEDVGSDAQFVSADFASVDDVADMVEEVQDAVDELDVLCNNAGGLLEDRDTTELGVGQTFHINHLSPYQLTAGLLDTLADDARVVTTSSIGHRVATLNLDNILEMDATGTVSPWAAYCRSKLANLRFSNELARRLDAAGSDVTSNALHPGIIPGSEFSRSLPSFAQRFGDLISEFPLADKPEDGAATILYLAGSDEVADVSGKYFANCRERRPDPNARDEDAQRALWTKSAKLLNIDEPLAEYARD